MALLKALGAFGSFVSKARESLSSNMSKLQGKAALDRLASCAYLIASADGGIDADETDKFVNIVKRNAPQYTADDARAAFNRARDNGDEAALLKMIGEAPAEEGEMLVMAAVAIGGADDNFDEDEKAITRRICGVLFIAPARMGL